MNGIRMENGILCFIVKGIEYTKFTLFPLVKFNFFDFTEFNPQ